MTQDYGSFGSYILFKEILTDDIGHIYRAGEFDATGVKRTTWLRVFDGPAVPRTDLERSLDTARSIADTLQAANIPTGTTYFVADGVPALASDYLAGQPLARLFSKVQEEGFPVPVDNALLIMEKLSLGLSAALAIEVDGQSLVHGFLEPGMVLVTNDGEAVVGGFGIGQSLIGLLDNPMVAERVLPYLAPEVIESRTTTKKGDVYSLGSILYHLLVGSPLPADPAARAGVLDSAELLFEDEPIPNDIKTLIARCIAERAEDRFSSAADFKKDLDRLLYGGNYSPTTFNLALFMDRLFRSDIEDEEKEREAEKNLDVQPYLMPEPEPEIVEETQQPTASKGGNKGLLYAVAAVLVAVAVGVVFMVTRETGPPPTPTPTPEEIAAQRAAQEEKIRELAARLVEEKMQEQEEQIRGELEASQQRIEDLQKQLKKSESSAASAADRKRKQELQKQLEREQEEQRQRQAKADEEKRKLFERARLEAEERARKEAEEQKTAEARVPEPTAVPAAVAAVAEPTRPPVQTAQVTVNQFVDPTEVDTLPAVLKEAPVEWPRAAKKSRRQGMIILRATVGANGRVEAVEILRADEQGFGIPEAVSDAVRGYLFKPGTKDGVKIKTHATVTKRYVFR